MFKNQNLITELPNFFEKFLPDFLNFFQVFKITHFWVYFQFKAKFKVKNCVSSITTLKRKCKATFNVFILKNFLIMTVFFMVYILCQIKCLILNILIKLIRALQKIFFFSNLENNCYIKVYIFRFYIIYKIIFLNFFYYKKNQRHNLNMY